MSITCDIAIIGGGPGGYVAALRASQLGAHVVCIEERWLGGVCLNDGCIPTKTLLRTAEVLKLVRQAETYGVRAGEPQLDWARAQERRAEVVEQMTSGVGMLLDRAGVQVVRGRARFLRPNALRVALEDGEETVTAGAVIVATGSRTMQVPIPGIDGPQVIDSSGALALERLPASLCIIGGGVLGIEFASLFTTLGVEVTIIEMLPRLLPLMEAAIGEGLAWVLEQDGARVLVDTRVTAIEQGQDGASVAVSTPEAEERLEAELVLSAIGRSPNIEDLGLEAIGLRPTRQGIGVDDHLRTAVPGVYAIGDVAAEGPMLAHVAMHQGVVAVEHALGHRARIDYGVVPNCVFTLPEAASVGLSEEEARAQGYEVRCGTFALPNNGKAVAMGDTDGFIKIVAEAEHHALLGMHIVGPHASDLIMEGAMALGLEATLDEIEGTIHPHPTLAEAVHEACLAVRGRALHLPKAR